MTISDNDYFEIISELGYPVVPEDALEFTRTEIENFFIFPAMREYFSWFPKKEIQNVYVSSEFSFDFPDENTYGIIDARINTGVTGEGKTASPFVNALFFKEANHSYKMYGTNNSYGMDEAQYIEKAYERATNSFIRVKRIDVNESERKVTGFTTVNGEMIITWAKYSEDFNDIPFKKKSEVINLAKSKALRGFAMLRGQADSDTGVSFNVSDFISRADSLEDKTMTKWKEVSKVTIIRS